MKKKLRRYQINYLLEQVVAITVICILTFIDRIVSFDLKVITILVLIIYEVFIYYLYQRRKKKGNNEKNEADAKGYNEKYLWFELLLLADVLFVIALLNWNIMIRLLIGFSFYYIVSMIAKPYFGILNKKNNQEHKYR